jgi:hypothetical protein
MAAKKSAKTTPANSSNEAKPAAKKAAKVAKKTVAKKTAAPATTPDLVFTPAPAPAAAAAAEKPVVRKAVAKPSLDEVARAAYLNYRRRVEQGLPGDSHGDWLEAERQYSDPS